MPAQNETVADVLAEIRERAKGWKHGAHPSVTAEYALECANRLESALTAQASAVAVWKCNNCHHEFTPGAAQWKCGINAEYLAPHCPDCKCGNQYTYPMNPAAVAEKVERMGFSCDGGPLALSDDWQKLKRALYAHAQPAEGDTGARPEITGYLPAAGGSVVPIYAAPKDRQPGEVCIVCDWTDANPLPRFVEVEIDGHSVCFGWRDRGNGIKEIVIPAQSPAVQLESPNNDCVNCDGTGRQGGDGSPDPCTYCDATGVMPVPVESLAIVPEWTDEQCVQFACVAFRHAPKNLPRGVTLQDIRMGAYRVMNATPPTNQEGAAP